MREVRPLVVDGSPAAASALGTALDDAVGGRGPAVLPVGPDGPEPEPEPATLAPVADEIAVLVRTTGSTGTPKTVLLPAAALRASAAATHDRLGQITGHGPGRWLLALPAHHVAGVQVLLRSALAGHPAAVADLRAGFTPSSLVTDATYTSLVPTQLRRVLDDDAGLLRSFAAVLVGGAVADPALVARARAAGVTVVTTYGMSETCGGCVYDGRPLAGVDVAIGDDGRIRLGGAMLAAGYRGADGGCASALSGFSGGWFHTADLGAWGPDGRLEVLGRADDVIVSGGENVAPALVERALLGVDGVREACVVGVPHPEWGERVVAAVVGVGPDGGVLDGDAVRATVRAELGRATPRSVLVLDALPLRGIGKPDRDAVRALFS